MLVAYRLGSRCAQALPAGWIGALERPLGAVLAATMGDRRRMVERHLQRVHGVTLAPGMRRRLSRRSFGSYARYWIESFRLPGLDGADVDVNMWADGLEHIDAALATGRGAILALPHLGGWDFAGAWLVRRGYPLAVVVETVEPPKLLAWFSALRSEIGLRVIPLGPRAGAAVLAELRANRVVALLCDRDIGGGGVDVEFFGEHTTLPAGPATVAMRAKSALLPAAVYFEDGLGHRGEVRPSLAVERRGSLRSDVERLTQDLADELESLIRAAPEQWHLLQPNWPSDRVPEPVRPGSRSRPPRR